MQIARPSACQAGSILVENPVSYRAHRVQLHECKAVSAREQRKYSFKLQPWQPTKREQAGGRGWRGQGRLARTPALIACVRKKASLGANRHNPKKEWRADILNFSKATRPPKVAQLLGAISAPFLYSSQPLSAMRFLFSHSHQGTRKCLGSLTIDARAKSYQLSHCFLG